MELKPYDVVYLGMAYSAKKEDGTDDVALIEERMRIFYLCVEQLMVMNIMVLSPLFMHQVVKEGVTNMPNNWEYWRRYSITCIQSTEKMLILDVPGVDESTGVKGEEELADDWEMPRCRLDHKALLRGEIVILSSKN